MNRSPSFGTRARQVILPVLFLLYTVPGMLAQDPYPARIKSALILNFSAAVEWENEEEIDTFHIGLYGTEKGLASEMKLMETVALKGKPIVVHQFSRLSEISGIQALYVAIDRNSEIRRIAEAITGKNILLITDQCRDDIHTMINLIPPDKEDRTRFLINKANMILEHLKALPELIV